MSTGTDHGGTDLGRADRSADPRQHLRRVRGTPAAVAVIAAERPAFWGPWSLGRLAAVGNR
jgi:hypothetical protein